jgi:hypothetical protein
MPTILTTTYQPSVHGFHFPNDFVNHVIGPISTSGRCGGMAYCSLDYFFAGRAAPDIRVVNLGLTAQSGLAAASWDAGRIDLFVRHDDNCIAQKTFDGGWSDWSNVNAAPVSMSPSATTWGRDRLDLLVHEQDNNIWRTWYEGGWNGRQLCQQPPGYGDPLGGTWASSPAVASPFLGRLEVYARGTDNNLYFNYLDESGWHGWSNMGRPPNINLTSDPSAASQTGWMTALIRGSDNAIWQIEWADNRWQPWRSLGGIGTSAPAVASPFPGRLEAYVRGTDNNIWINIYEASHWGGWSALGAPPVGASDSNPAAVSHYGFMDVFVRANDNTVWHKQWSGGGWHDWASVELPISPQAQQLTDAIYGRLMATTVVPLFGALAFPPALPFLGSVKNFLTWLPYSDGQLWQWSSNDEMQKLTASLGAGRPIPLGLIPKDGVIEEHQVVAYGADISVQAPLGTNSLPGLYTFVRIYDNNYPDCDNITLKYDPTNQTIFSSSGEQWRGVFVRDDYSANAPPV